MSNPNPGSSASCSIRTIIPAINLLRVEGLPIEAALEAAGIREADLQDPDIRISNASMMRAWDVSHQIVGNPAFGLRVAETMDPDITALFAYLAASSETGRDAFQRATRYLRIVSDAIECKLEMIGQHSICSLHTEGAQKLPQAYADYVVGMMSILATKIVSEKTPLEVWFEHPAPDYLDEYQRVIPHPIRFSAERNGIGGLASTLDQPLPGADLTLRTLLEDQAQQKLDTLPVRQSFTDDVRHAITRGLDRGEFGMDATAKGLAISPRTLRRRLKEDELTHRQLVREVRCDVASRALANGMTANEVAFMVGFSDAPAFHKAFKRWTGKKPSELVDSGGGLKGT
jgi:AraC-like DNA-binding protein